MPSVEANETLSSKANLMDILALCRLKEASSKEVPTWDSWMISYCIHWYPLGNLFFAEAWKIARCPLQKAGRVAPAAVKCAAAHRKHRRSEKDAAAGYCPVTKHWPCTSKKRKKC